MASRQGTLVKKKSNKTITYVGKWLTQIGWELCLTFIGLVTNNLSLSKTSFSFSLVVTSRLKRWKNYATSPYLICRAILLLLPEKYNKQLLHGGFVISKIIEVETLIIQNFRKPEYNNICLVYTHSVILVFQAIRLVPYLWLANNCSSHTEWMSVFIYLRR